MPKVSQIGEELKRKSREKEQQLETEFRESLRRLEESLTKLSTSKLTAIESDTKKKLDEIGDKTEEALEKMDEDWREKIQRLVNANHKFYKKTIESEKREWTEELKKWRKLLLILLPTALIFGLVLGVFATLYLSPAKGLTVKESEIVRAKDGTPYLPISKIPNLSIIKNSEGK